MTVAATSTSSYVSVDRSPAIDPPYSPNVVAVPLLPGISPRSAGSGSDLVAREWAAPSPALAPPGGAAAAPRGAEGGSIAASNARTRESALLAADVYADAPNPPAGFRVANAADLARLNITAPMLETGESSFRARVYATGQGDDVRYVVAFRGSSAGEDWRNNAQQALGLNSESYQKALNIGERLARSDESVTLAGHSLGGGLASAAAIASGREADTFNAAGLTDRTIEAAKSISAANGRGGGDVAVQASYVRGEVLSTLQDGGDRLLGRALLGPVGWLADAPSAYGTRHVLPNATPEGKSWVDWANPVDRHGMDWVLAGTAALR